MIDVVGRYYSAERTGSPLFAPYAAIKPVGVPCIRSKESCNENVDRGRERND